MSKHAQYDGVDSLMIEAILPLKEIGTFQLKLFV